MSIPSICASSGERRIGVPRGDDGGSIAFSKAGNMTPSESSSDIFRQHKRNKYQKSDEPICLPFLFSFLPVFANLGDLLEGVDRVAAERTEL